MTLSARALGPNAVHLRTEEPPPETLGGKGAALARLLSSGYPVPDTGVVTTDAYRRIAAEPTIAAMVQRIVDGEVIPADDVDAVFAAAPIPADVATDVAELARSVGDGGPVAVRSSATVEDLHGSSFAGQYRSLLDVDSSLDTAALSAVRAVWASLWHPAPSAYRQAFGIDQLDVAMAVVVMRMIPATTAGVVFTADPGGSSGARVEAVDGLGESLVSGQRTPRAWVVENGTAADGSGGALPTAPARALDLARDIAAGAGTPQDVEWAAVDDEVFVVQARPITVLDDEDGFDTPIDDHELTTAGIVEMVPGVLAALPWELNRFLLEEAFRSVLDSLGILRGRSAEDRPFVRRVRGRVAIDFDQLREAAAGIPGAVEELEQQYFGEAEQTVEDRDHRHRLGWTSLKRDVRTLRTRRQVIAQADVVIVATHNLRSRRLVLSDLGDDQLLAYVRRLVDLAARGLAAELGVAASGAAAYRRLELQLGRHLGVEPGARAAMAVTANSGAAVDRLASASAAIFAGPTWNELGSAPPQSIGSTISADERKAPWEQLRHQLKTLPGWTRRRVLSGGFVDFRLHLISRLVTDVGEQIRRREEAKAAVLELGGEVRRVHLELGRRFVADGLLDKPDQIDLLASADVMLACEGTVQFSPDVLRRRLNWLTRYESEGLLPLRFTGVPDRQPAPLPDGDVLSGWAASPGRRRGRARVVSGPDGTLEPGEVLVAEATDASWSPLFLRAGAIVVERGGPLSHAAILARELGLPAVLNVAGASRVLDGRTVSVDGDQGLVVIESEATEP